MPHGLKTVSYVVQMNLFFVWPLGLFLFRLNALALKIRYPFPPDLRGRPTSTGDSDSGTISVSLAEMLSFPVTWLTFGPIPKRNNYQDLASISRSPMYSWNH